MGHPVNATRFLWPVGDQGFTVQLFTNTFSAEIKVQLSTQHSLVIHVVNQDGS